MRKDKHNASVNIIIPANNIKERQYIIDIIFGQFLCLDYFITISNEVSNYIIETGSGSLVILDSFFQKNRTELSYLCLDNIPKEINWFTYKCNSYPMIYGDDYYKHEGNVVYCGLDIFASSFFMLSRWEEYVIPSKDKFGRILESEMFVVKNNLEKRPIVNEYISLLRELMSIFIALPEPPYNFRIFLTHDIDYLYRFDRFKSFLRNVAGDILNRKSLAALSRTLKGYYRYLSNKEKDPFDTFDELMTLSEKYGFRSSFYFKPSVRGDYDYTYDITDDKVRNLFGEIRNRGHEVGIHPSIITFNNRDQFYLEYQRISSVEPNIVGGRQHYLLYSIPSQLSYWEECGLQYDSGLGFHSRIGFRCGVCWSYKMFNILDREMLNIEQRPLIVMDAALMRWSPTPEKMYNDILRMINVVKRYNGLFVFLWHNDRFYRHEFKNYRKVYYKVIQYLAEIYSN